MWFTLVWTASADWIWSGLEDAIDENTILVSLMQVNNEAGTIMPVDAVKDLMKKKNAPGWFHCDAVQSFGKLQVPESADLISVSSHKIHGPKGAGALFVRKGIHLAGAHRRRRPGAR